MATKTIPSKCLMRKDWKNYSCLRCGKDEKDFSMTSEIIEELQRVDKAARVMEDNGS